MLVSDFDFDLPERLIAQEAAPRGESRLLVLDRDTGGLRHDRIANIPLYLRAGDLFVVNNTRVFPARLLGHRTPSGGASECLLLRRTHAESADVEEWDALVHPGQKLKPGALVRFEGPAGVLTAEILERRFHGRRSIRLRAEDGSVTELIDALGHVPLPPYIQRDDTRADRERYQTVFAERRGSVAAPTAGLHFTPALLDAIRARGVAIVNVTLHVGYGTFKPVRADVVEDHVVDPEEYKIDAAAAGVINRALDDRRPVIAVGTTTTRALEDAARRGDGRIRPGAAEADAFIYPGVELRVVSGLVTNFHLPKSSLLMLVAALAGRERVLHAYTEAVRAEYRFYSYGDAMFIR